MEVAFVRVSALSFTGMRIKSHGRRDADAVPPAS